MTSETDFQFMKHINFVSISSLFQEKASSAQQTLTSHCQGPNESLIIKLEDISQKFKIQPRKMSVVKLRSLIWQLVTEIYGRPQIGLKTLRSQFLVSLYCLGKQFLLLYQKMQQNPCLLQCCPLQFCMSQLILHFLFIPQWNKLGKNVSILNI